ncbi:MAG: N-acetylglutaminylglutamine synthetase [Verrucomicrobia bacterium]|jgi:GNAT-family acetyltransferase (TIGR03103 family)|nr:N-acetylglutaminylglutamine synthetase [Verrucomicrobiota bacterium]
MKALVTEPGTVLQCGWGRLLFGDTFPTPASLAEEILAEDPQQRDIALYLVDPHLLLNHAPQKIFLDPSNTYRLALSRYKESGRPVSGFSIRPLRHKEEIDEMNRIYTALGMMPVKEAFVWEQRASEIITYVLAIQAETGRVLGVAMGADHRACGDHMPNRSSVWAVGVDPQAELPGVGESLTRYLIEHYRELGREALDVSVVHDNEKALKLYEKLGFERIHVFAAKCRNRVNEPLFVGSNDFDEYNPYARIIIDEALRRGIAVEPLDPGRGYFRLSLGGRSVTCWESLSELTSAIALKRTDDKQFTRDILGEAGLSVPDQIVAGDEEEDFRFLDKHRSVVVKPLQGEQGQGISVDIRSESSLRRALAKAREHGETVLLEECIDGKDLRIIVINREVVAAAVRRPPSVIGTGDHTIRQLIERLSRRRSSATGGESRIHVDEETERCLRRQGYQLEDVLKKDVAVEVRRTANLHTGGTMHDVTGQLHPDLARAAVTASLALEIPVVGLDMIVEAPEKPAYALIEGNERPGLANHEPQPTAEKFIDFLFPQSLSPLP